MTRKQLKEKLIQRIQAIDNPIEDISRDDRRHFQLLRSNYYIALSNIFVAEATSNVGCGE